MQSPSPTPGTPTSPDRQLSPGRPETRRGIVRDSWAVGAATGLYGLSFGAVSVASGLSLAQTCLLSLVMFTGASQFAFVGVVATGGSPFSGTLAALMLGSRNTFYGIGLAPLLRLSPAARALAAHLVIDESTAMSVNRSDTETARLAFWHTGGSVFLLWNLATLIGAVVGDALGDPRTYGLDAAVGAAFLALLWPRLTERSSRRVALVAAVVAIALVPSTPAGVPVLAAGAVALAVGLFAPGEQR